jgi:hypothetical protein
MTERERLEKDVVDTKAAFEAAYDDAIAHVAWVMAKLELREHLKKQGNE